MSNDLYQHGFQSKIFHEITGKDLIDTSLENIRGFLQYPIFKCSVENVGITGTDPIDIPKFYTRLKSWVFQKPS